MQKHKECNKFKSLHTKKFQICIYRYLQSPEPRLYFFNQSKQSPISTFLLASNHRSTLYQNHNHLHNQIRKFTINHFPFPQIRQQTPLQSLQTPTIHITITTNPPNTLNYPKPLNLSLPIPPPGIEATRQSNSLHLDGVGLARELGGDRVEAMEAEFVGVKEFGGELGGDFAGLGEDFGEEL